MLTELTVVNDETPIRQGAIHILFTCAPVLPPKGSSRIERRGSASLLAVRSHRISRQRRAALRGAGVVAALFMLGLAATPRLLSPQCQPTGGSAPGSKVRASAVDRRQFLGIMSQSALAAGLDGGAVGNGASVEASGGGGKARRCLIGISILALDEARPGPAVHRDAAVQTSARRASWPCFADPAPAPVEACQIATISQVHLAGPRYIQ